VIMRSNVEQQVLRSVLSADLPCAKNQKGVTPVRQGLA